MIQHISRNREIYLAMVALLFLKIPGIAGLPLSLVAGWILGGLAMNAHFYRTGR